MATATSVMPGEDESWAQTFVTVTPHEDGFLREINENVVVSGLADSPLQLDTWNIVLRRSLVKGTKEWIEPGELERSSRVVAECQTYLQGVPRVELPRVYADEATQTLYMGRDGATTTTATTFPAEYFADIIGVLNAKSLPELRISHAVQTAVSASGDGTDVAGKLLENAKSTTPSDLPAFAETSEREAARMEATDVLNFVVERTLWMISPARRPPAETRDVGVQTSMKYDHRQARLLIDYEAQTELTCKPSYSNSKLLGGEDVVDAPATGSPRTLSQNRRRSVARSSNTIGGDEVVEETASGSPPTIFPFHTFPGIPDTIDGENAATKPVELIVKPIVTVARRNGCEVRCPQLLRLAQQLEGRNGYSSSSDSESSGSITWSSSASSGERTSSSRESLPVNDERALDALRTAFHVRLNGPN